ncbi:MAG: dihydrodipicolinate synthase family protein [Armatimonadota bacterium]
MQLSASGKQVEMWPVMLTPFTQSLEIDWNGVDALVDWYINNGADGLFAVCLSSEMYDLSQDERLELAARVVKHTAGRVPLIASGTFGGSMQSQADDVKRMYDAGVNSVVVIASQVVESEADDAEWLANLHQLMALTGDIPLGLYECPSPYHRLLTPELVGEISMTGRFHYYKDTSCDREVIRQKVAAVDCSSMKWMNANAPTLLYSLELGGCGFMGIGANFLPAHFAWLCRHFLNEPEEAERMQRFLSVADMVVRNKYPTSAKLFMASLGLPIEPVCRNRDQVLSDEELLILDHLKGMSKDNSIRLDEIND